MEEQNIKILLEKYKAGTVTEEEKSILDNWYLHVAVDGSEDLSAGERLKTFDTVLANLETTIYPGKEYKLWPRIAAAASIIFALSVGGYFILHHTANQQIAQNQRIKNDVPPGKNKATLTLANGRQIVLDNTKSGLLAHEGDAVVNKTADGKIVYEAPKSSTQATEAVAYNTLTTKRGQQYPLVLSDGTRVWLNSASSITYPAVFTGNVRSVKLTGEAYFEVSHEAARKFVVQTLHGDIQDIGTHFNVMAYDDEKLFKTTLLEGAVKVTERGEQPVILKPGEEAQVANTHSASIITVIPNADIDEAVAWRNNLFKFKNADIGYVMRQVSRWYNVDIKYASGAVPEGHLTGYISRDVSISHMIAMLEQASNLKLSVEDRVVTVSQ